jgi:hypothetical protein
MQAARGRVEPARDSGTCARSTGGRGRDRAVDDGRSVRKCRHQERQRLYDGLNGECSIGTRLRRSQHPDVGRELVHREHHRGSRDGESCIDTARKNRVSSPKKGKMKNEKKWMGEHNQKRRERKIKNEINFNQFFLK